MEKLIKIPLVKQTRVNQRLWMLVNKGSCFRDMVIHPLVDELGTYSGTGFYTFNTFSKHS